MNLQTFRAPTMAECLGEVKRVMGPDAVILHTRTLTIKRFLGLKRREIVEITAGRGLNGGPRGPQRRSMQQKPPQRAVSGSNGNGAYASSNGGGGVATMAPPSTVSAAIQSLPAPVAGADPAMFNKLFDEMGQMKKIVAEIERRKRLKDGPDIAPELF